MSKQELALFEEHKENSHCDNVLLEYSIVLELFDDPDSSLKRIAPLLVGNVAEDKRFGKKEYIHYFRDNCKPNCPDIRSKPVHK